MPHRPALDVGEQTLTYGDLRDRAASLAATLQVRTPSGGSPMTAVLADRSTTAFAGILGSLLAGRAYVPLNPNFPPVRTRWMLQQAECRSLITEGVIGWRPPWQIGALDALRRPQSHLFTEQLRGKAIDLNRLAGAWAAISDARLAAYRGALPTEWNAALDSADKALSHIAAVKDNLEPALQEIVRVLQ